MVKLLLVLSLIPCFAAAELPNPKIEAALLKKHPKVFERKNGKLTLRLLGGANKIFTDNLTEDGEKHLRTFAHDYLPEQSVAILEQRYYEGGRFIVIPLKSGIEITVPKPPVWSQKKDAFISLNDDESDYTDNNVIIALCKNQNCKVEYKLFSSRAGREKWVSNSQVNFDRFVYDNGTGELVESQTFECVIGEKVVCTSKDIKSERSKKR